MSVLYYHVTHDRQPSGKLNLNARETPAAQSGQCERVSAPQSLAFDLKEHLSHPCQHGIGQSQDALPVNPRKEEAVR
ncbi:hypothetical protein FQN60_004745 [Etheostoma spectabile]|uniref:Uncharacterized protein n=1 Tax=Etheostoma spectabile TaxID=54343 RepID=A0A5J5DKR9_9PERO|nr:hypothetical protein FQN60_004745 [Etheostoma spectabile]